MPSLEDTEARGLTRRHLTTAAVWSMPAVAMAVATPALAVSGIGEAPPTIFLEWSVASLSQAGEATLSITSTADLLPSSIVTVVFNDPLPGATTIDYVSSTGTSFTTFATPTGFGVSGPIAPSASLSITVRVAGPLPAPVTAVATSTGSASRPTASFSYAPTPFLSWASDSVNTPGVTILTLHTPASYPADAETSITVLSSNPHNAVTLYEYLDDPWTVTPVDGGFVMTGRFPQADATYPGQVYIAGGDAATITATATYPGTSSVATATLAFESPTPVVYLGDYLGRSSHVQRIAPDGSRMDVVTQVDKPGQIAAGPEGELYVLDPSGRRIIRRSSGGEETVFAQNTSVGVVAVSRYGAVFADELTSLTSVLKLYRLDGAVSVSPPLAFVRELTVDRYGDQYVGLEAARTLNKVASGVVTLLLTNISVSAMATTATGTPYLYVGDRLNDRILRFSDDGSYTVFATGVLAYGIAVSRSGSIYVSEWGTKVWKYAPDGSRTHFADQHESFNSGWLPASAIAVAG